MKQKINGFHRDERGDWVANLECGHRQHVRHDPPWMMRPWVETPAGRESRIGVELDCRRCDEMKIVYCPGCSTSKSQPGNEQTVETRKQPEAAHKVNHVVPR